MPACSVFPAAPVRDAKARELKSVDPYLRVLVCLSFCSSVPQFSVFGFLLFLGVCLTTFRLVGALRTPLIGGSRLRRLAWFTGERRTAAPRLYAYRRIGSAIHCWGG